MNANAYIEALAQKIATLEAALAERTAERDAAERVADEAVKWIGCVRDELIIAGGETGDRTVALANLRRMIARLAASEEREKALRGAAESALDRIGGFQITGKLAVLSSAMRVLKDALAASAIEEVQGE